MEYFERLWEALPAGIEPEGFAHRRAFLLRHVRPGLRVLDLGCGEGFFTQALQEAGARVSGADVAREALRRASARGLDLHHIKAGVLPFADAEFDLVWAGELLEHVQDLVALAAEIERVLLPGGTLALSTPDHGLALRLRLALAPGAFARHFEPRADHVRFFVPASLRALLLDAGLQAPAIERSRGSLLAIVRKPRTP